MNQAEDQRDGGPVRIEDLIILGRITRPQGCRGGVRVFPYFEPAQLFDAYRSDRVTLLPGGDAARPSRGPAEPEVVRIRSFYYHKQFIVMEFEGVADMDAAERLRDRELAARPEDLWPLARDEFFAFELAGFAVLDADTRAPLGTVVEIEPGAAHDYVRTRGPEREFRIPFVRAFIREVDTANRIMLAAIPEGLDQL